MYKLTNIGKPCLFLTVLKVWLSNGIVSSSLLEESVEFHSCKSSATNIIIANVSILRRQAAVVRMFEI